MAVDLSTPRAVSLEEVAELFKQAPTTIKTRVQQDNFPVKPIDMAIGRNLTWSSVQLLAYFTNPDVYCKTQHKKSAK